MSRFLADVELREHVCLWEAQARYYTLICATIVGVLLRGYLPQLHFVRLTEHILILFPLQQYRTLQPLLSRYSSQFDTASKPLPQARVLWMSSVDALAMYDPDTDWQLIKTDTSYQSSKAQMDFLVMELTRRDHVPIPSSPSSTSPTSPAIRHLLVSPGITATKMAAELLRSYILELCMLAFFHFVRMLGSPHVNFTTYKAAVAASHATLAPAQSIPTSAAGEEVGKGEETPFPKFTVLSDRLGRERVGIYPVEVWDKHPDEGARLLERCERLYQVFVEREKGKE